MRKRPPPALSTQCRNIMDLEPIFTQIVNEVLVPVVTTAVKTAMAEAPKKPKGNYMTVPEACLMLKCSQPTFYDHVHKGQIKLYKQGHSSLVDKDKLMKDLEDGNLKFRQDKHRRK